MYLINIIINMKGRIGTDTVEFRMKSQLYSAKIGTFDIIQ